MGIKTEREHFERTKMVHESAKLVFRGVDGFDVYNASIPFPWRDDIYIFGRVERRADWARSWVRLFAASGRDEWTLVPDSMIYPLEDPYIAWIGNELVMGGTHVRYKAGAVDTYSGYFYRGVDLHDLRYFTTGPDHMKDIRLVQLADGRIGVFSRPRNAEILKRFGCESQIGFTVIDGLDELTGEVIEQAPSIPGLFAEGEWGGPNQAYLLEDGMLGVIGHQCYNALNAAGARISTYLNIAFIFDPRRHRASERKVIGTRSCYPAGPAKKPGLVDCAFTAGIVMRPDGRADLYSGIGDTEVGRLVIDDPFAGHGGIAKTHG